MIATELIVILLLLALNGVFAMSELAILTAQRVRLEQRADEGDKGAKAPLKLAHDPTQFLSTVQGPGPRIVRQQQGVWAIHGSVGLEDVETTLDLLEIPAEVRSGVRTLGGLVMTLLGRVARIGDVVRWDGLQIEVTAMDGQRIEGVLATKIPTEPREGASHVAGGTAPPSLQ